MANSTVRERLVDGFRNEGGGSPRFVLVPAPDDPEISEAFEITIQDRIETEEEFLEGFRAAGSGTRTEPRGGHYLYEMV